MEDLIPLHLSMLNSKLRLIIKLFNILLPLLLIVIFFEVKARNLDNGFTLKKEIIERNLDSVNILILGSSHGFKGINPELINKKVINMANYSQDLYYDFMIFDRYKQKLVSLKCIILTLSYFSLWYDLNDASESWRKYFYKRYYNIDTREPLSFSDWFDIKRYSYAFFYRFDNTLLGYINPKLFTFGSRMNLLGWCTDTINISIDSTETMIKNGVERINHTNSLINKYKIIENYKYIENLVKYSNENNIKFIFVTTPVSYPYLLYMDKDISYEMQNTVKYFTDNKDVFYLNYFYDIRFNMKDFSDYDHLNVNGTEKFSKIIRDTLVNMKIIN